MDAMTGSYLEFQKLISFYVQVIALSSVRFWGVFFMFPIFIWAGVPPMVTMVWGFCFALPALPGMVSVLSQTNLTVWPITSSDLAGNLLPMLQQKQTTIINLKEFFLGAMLAFFPSAFFYGFITTGELIDQARGDIGGKSAGGGNLQMTNGGTVLFLAGAMLFFASGEFIHFIRLIYRSYEVWPLFDLSGFMSPERMFFFLDLSLMMMFGMVKMGLPFFVLMWSFDIQSLYQAKIDKKFQGQEYQPALKNFLFAFFFIFYLNYSDNEQYNPSLSIASNFSVIIEGGSHGTFNNVR